MTCTEWLKYFLNVNKRVEVSVIRKMRKALGFSKTEIAQAKSKLGVVVENNANAFQSAERWYWRLP